MPVTPLTPLELRLYEALARSVAALNTAHYQHEVPGRAREDLLGELGEAAHAARIVEEPAPAAVTHTRVARALRTTLRGLGVEVADLGEPIYWLAHAAATAPRQVDFLPPLPSGVGACGGQIAADGRRRGASPLRGRPLDEDGSIEFLPPAGSGTWPVAPVRPAHPLVIALSEGPGKLVLGELALPSGAIRHVLSFHPPAGLAGMTAAIASARLTRADCVDLARALLTQSAPPEEMPGFVTSSEIATEDPLEQVVKLRVVLEGEDLQRLAALADRTCALEKEVARLGGTLLPHEVPWAPGAAPLQGLGHPLPEVHLEAGQGIGLAEEIAGVEE